MKRLNFDPKYIARIDNQLKITTHNPQCFFCGRFIGKNDEWEGKTIYGHLSPDCDIIYHKKCKNDK